MSESASNYCAEILRRQDADRYLTALFAPADRRGALFALYAFNLEVARAREVVSEPLMGLIRLQWWRDALDEIYLGRVLAHEVARPLAAAIARHKLDRKLFESLIATRERDLDPEPPADLAALVDYAEGTSATLVRLALQILGEPNAAAWDAGKDVGIAWALTGLIRALPFHATQRRLYMPRKLMAEAGLSPSQIFERGSGATAAPLAKVVGAVAAEARIRLAHARGLAAQVSRRFQPALLPATLAAGYLRSLAAAGHDPFDERVQRTPPWRVWTLAGRRLIGGY